MTAALPSWCADVEKSRGSEWIRAALQVNPYSYAVRHAVKGTAASEEEHNRIIVKALTNAGIGLAAVTDHFRISDSVGLLDALAQAEITALPGFEAHSSEGIHLLVIFAETATAEDVSDAIKAAALHDPDAASPISRLSAAVLMEEMADRGGACVAAHATQDNGVLRATSGSARMLAWTSPHLLGAAIPGAVEDCDLKVVPILKNENPEHARASPIAIINAGDISLAADASRPGCTTLFRMTEPGLVGLRHALADPESRVRLNSDGPFKRRPVIRAIHWDGGFLDGQTINFSSDLNVLIGAPGSGKSTVIESLRACFELEAVSERAQSDHDDLVSAALSDTTVSVVMEHPNPVPSRIVVQRTVPHPSEVLSWDTFEPTGRPVKDLRPLPELYGQHEISDLANDELRRTELLERFVQLNETLERKIVTAESELASLDGLIEEAEELVDELTGRAGLLPSLEQELQRWIDQGVAEKLKQQVMFDREHRYLVALEKVVQDVDTAVAKVPHELPAVPAPPANLADSSFWSDMEAARAAAAKAVDDTAHALQAAREVVQTQRDAVGQTRLAYKRRRAEHADALAQAQKALGADIDAAEFREIQQRVDDARAAKKELPEAQTALSELEAKRRQTLVEREKTFAEQARRLQSAADSVSAKLSRVRVSVRAGADLRAFREFAARNLKGFRAPSFAALRAKQNLSFRGLAEACRAGEVQLKALAPFSPSDVNRLAGLSGAALRELEALPQAVATGIELNVALRGTPVWRRIEDLSRGQKATAILLLLLLPSEAPLVVDQPEDDLDNRFIVDDVVPAIRQTKADRQYILATHNANVPVLADAELIAGLTPVGDAGSAGTAEVLPQNCGSIDKASVCDLVEQQLEGGHAAFEERRRRYAHGAPASSNAKST